MTRLSLGHEYTRQEVHKFFGGNTNFSRGSGTWGNHGMLRTEQDNLSWVFYVTLGQKQGAHQFDEGVSDQGVLTWQSQPSLALDNKKILDLINFDQDEHNIYLFIRRNGKEDYRYLGRLGYLAHNPDIEKPVYFEWQLLDWDQIKQDRFVKELAIMKSTSTPRLPEKLNENAYSAGLKLSNNQQPYNRKKAATFGSNVPGGIDLNLERRKQVGDMGESIVVKYEKKMLRDANRHELADAVEHSALVIGDGLGYDVKSFNEDGSVKYIEVKTTTQNNALSDFFISSGEMAFADAHKDSYVIYRLYDLDEKNECASFFEISAEDLLNKDIYDHIPTNYRVACKK